MKLPLSRRETNVLFLLSLPTTHLLNNSFSFYLYANSSSFCLFDAAHIFGLFGFILLHTLPFVRFSLFLSHFIPVFSSSFRFFSFLSTSVNITLIFLTLMQLRNTHPHPHLLVSEHDAQLSPFQISRSLKYASSLVDQISLL